MNKLKRIVSLLCVLALMMAFAVTASAADAMKISGTQIDPAKTDNQVIKISISGNTGLVGFKLHFVYNPEKIEIVSVEAGDVTKKGNFIDNADLHEGEFDVLWNNVSDVEGDGTVVLLTVKMLKNESTTIRVNYSQPDTCSYDETTGDFVDVVFDCKDISTVGGDKSEDATMPNEIEDSATVVAENGNTNGNGTNGTEVVTDAQGNIIEGAEVDGSNDGAAALGTSAERNDLTKYMIIFFIALVITVIVGVSKMKPKTAVDKKTVKAEDDIIDAIDEMELFEELEDDFDEE